MSGLEKMHGDIRDADAYVILSGVESDGVPATLKATLEKLPAER